MPDAPSPAQQPVERIQFLDGLRGVAAMGVVICHASSMTVDHLSVRNSTPAAVRELFDYGGLGVAVFFVLSGFVIANALGDSKVTPRSAGRFILRRSLRLDPPYWFAIGLSIATTVVIAGFARAAPELPGGRSILAHLFYLQGWLGFPQIIGVFWTLCIEVQFYLSFVLLLAVSQRLRLPFGLVAFPPLIASLFVIHHDGISRVLDRDVSIIPHAAMFYLGVTACHACRGRGRFWFACGVAGVIVRLVLSWEEFLGTGLVTSLFLVVAFHRERIGAPLCGPGIQFLGMLSYSLYLTHRPIQHFVSLAVFRLLGRTTTAGWTAMVAVILTSIVFAYPFFLAIERPSLRLAKRVSR